MKDQWVKGLQWGSVAWLAWIAAKASLGVFHCTIEPGAYFAASMGWLLERSIVAGAWCIALALAWTRWSRIGVGAAIVVQAIAGTIVATTYEGPIPIPWVLTFWLPMSLPLLPLLVMNPTGPRHTAALVLVGRFRDAGRTLAGWRWALVAAGVVALNRAGWNALRWDIYGADGALRFDPWAIPAALLPWVLLWSLAAIPRLPWRAAVTA